MEGLQEIGNGFLLLLIFVHSAWYLLFFDNTEEDQQGVSRVDVTWCGLVRYLRRQDRC